QGNTRFHHAAVRELAGSAAQRQSRVSAESESRLIGEWQWRWADCRSTRRTASSRRLRETLNTALDMSVAPFGARDIRARTAAMPKRASRTLPPPSRKAGGLAVLGAAQSWAERQTVCPSSAGSRCKLGPWSIFASGAAARDLVLYLARHKCGTMVCRLKG